MISNIVYLLLKGIYIKKNPFLFNTCVAILLGAVSGASARLLFKMLACGYPPENKNKLIRYKQG